MRDAVNNIDVSRGISPVSINNNDLITSRIVDIQGYQGLAIIVGLGSVADTNATFTVKVQDSDTETGSDFEDVALAQLILKENFPLDFNYDDDNRISAIGYNGWKRYVRVTIQPAGNSGAMLHAITFIRSFSEWSPTSL